MSRLSKTPLGIDWLRNFSDESERETAASLIDEILLVNRDALARGLHILIESILSEREDTERPVALFAERAVPKRRGTVLPFFPGSEKGTAKGQGIPPVVTDPASQEVGSEGLIGNLITDLVRRHGRDMISHPGPDQMRKARVRNIVIVTDFIGSGKRVFEMLEAFRGVASLRSWRSYGLLIFNVVAYSATEVGLRTVHSNRLKPKISTIVGCPTLYNTFSGAQLSNVICLCRKYPSQHRYPTGFLHSGVLIAFAHGMPNNAPPILHSRKGDWDPLFPGRSTTGSDMSFPANAIDTLADRAARLLRIRDAYEHLSNPKGRRWITTMMVLAALEAGARSVQSVSARSSLDLNSVEEILGYTLIARWTTERHIVTPLGKQELARLRRRRRRAPVLPTSRLPFYYPTQLRAR